MKVNEVMTACQNCSGSGEIEFCSCCHEIEEDCSCEPEARETYFETCDMCDGEGEMPEDERTK